MNLEPSSQLNLFSHKEEFQKLINLYKNNNLPNKILFSGEKGIGKCTLTYHLINYILSSDEDFSYDLDNLKIIPGWFLKSHQGPNAINVLELTRNFENQLHIFKT